jgi:hypothetical protein
VEADGIDMKKVFVNCLFLTADRYTTLALRSSTRSKWENWKIVFFSSIYKKYSTFRPAPKNSAERLKNTASIAGLRMLVEFFKKKLLRINPADRHGGSCYSKPALQTPQKPGPRATAFGKAPPRRTG